MASYQITSTGNPILPINLEIKFPLSATVTYVYPIVSNQTGQNLIDFINAYGRNEEDAIKTQSVFSTQDNNRNSITSFEDLGDLGNGYHSYSVTINFNITNAEVVQYANVSNDLVDTARAEYLAGYANSIEVAFKTSNTNWICE